MNVDEVLARLNFGDVIEIAWLDASEATGRLQQGRFDTPVRSVGFFLGVQGRKARHVVIAKEVIDDAKAYHYNVIPLGMIVGIVVHARDALDPYTKRVLKKFAQQTILKLKGKDGWAYAQGENPKRIH